MVVGFNHNFSYKGQVYHVQTEDSGVKNPHIITLLYRGGTILASKKTSYADIIKVDNLETVVEDLMKAQHREMLRLLKNGDFDALLGLPVDAAKTAPAPAPAAVAPVIAAPAAVAPVIAAPAAVAPVIAAPAPAPLPAPPSPPPTVAVVTPPAPPLPPPQKEKGPDRALPPPPPPPAALSLDDIILSYMVGEERKK